MRQAKSAHREGQLFWTWPLEARSELFPAAPWAPLTCIPGPWHVALTPDVIFNPLPPPCARLTLSPELWVGLRRNHM